MAELIFPRELTPDLLEVLGMSIFRCAPIAHAFKAAGRLLDGVEHNGAPA